MKREDVIKLYKEVKRRRREQRVKPSSLITHNRSKGCKSCGRVTWKPDQS